MKILLTGARGQLGRELHRQLPMLGEILALDRTACDLSRPERIPKLIGDFKPDIIVNAAAYTAVDQAEEEEALATTINATAVGVMAEQARKHNALLLHYSTDYVFDGTKHEPYTEEDIPNPINAYGRSKLAGEEAIRQSDCEHLIVRTSWVYSAHGNNFVNTMLKLAASNNQLRIVKDQTGSPTSVELIADVSALALYKLKNDPEAENSRVGTYHLTASGETSWHGLASYAIEQALHQGVILKAKPENIVPILTREYPTAAARPQNSRLNTCKLESWLGVDFPQWQCHVKRMVTETISEVN